MTLTDPELATMAQTLEQSESIAFCGACRFGSIFPHHHSPVRSASCSMSRPLDWTTTSDEVVELGMIEFSYHRDGSVGSVIETFSAFNEPSQMIPEDATKLHGITNEMVAGHKIDAGAIDAFAADAAIIIAHHAAFDRKFAERY